MEVKIGIQHAPRELTVETSESRETVLQALRDAAASKDGMFVLTDDRGSSVAVPAAKVAYLEFTGESGRKVGFGA